GRRGECGGGDPAEFDRGDVGEIDAIDEDVDSRSAHAWRKIVYDGRRSDDKEVVGGGRRAGRGLDRDWTVGRASRDGGLDLSSVLGEHGERRGRFVVEQHAGRADKIVSFDNHGGAGRAASGGKAGNTRGDDKVGA